MPIEVPAKEQQDQELTVDEIKQRIADLTKQQTELTDRLSQAPLSEDETVGLQAKIESLRAAIQAYELMLANKIAGQTSQPEETAGETIIPSQTPRPTACVVPVEKLEAILPCLQAERSMSWGAQRLVQALKHLIYEARKHQSN